MRCALKEPFDLRVLGRHDIQTKPSDAFHVMFQMSSSKIDSTASKGGDHVDDKAKADEMTTDVSSAAASAASSATALQVALARIAKAVSSSSLPLHVRFEMDKQKTELTTELQATVWLCSIALARDFLLSQILGAFHCYRAWENSLGQLGLDEIGPFARSLLIMIRGCS